MGKRLATHRSRIRWINSCWEDLDGINAPLKWSQWATLKWYRKHLHDKQKSAKRERKEKQKWFSSSEYKLKRIRYERSKIADGHDLR